jgi:hypothetical protein
MMRQEYMPVAYASDTFHRYPIETSTTPDIVLFPSRFRKAEGKVDVDARTGVLFPVDLSDWVCEQLPTWDCDDVRAILDDLERTIGPGSNVLQVLISRKR